MLISYLIRGTCFINSIPFITIIDTDATHSLLSAECVSRLNLEVCAMSGNLVIDTPANGSVTTLLVCLSYPLTIYDRDFGIDFVCLPLSQLDVILVINGLEFNQVFINYFDKSLKFLEYEDSTSRVSLH